MTEEQGQLIELISEDKKLEGSKQIPTKFQQNECSYEINKYKSLDNNNKSFIPSNLVHIDFINCRNIFLSAFISLNFYLLLILIIQHAETYAIIFIIIIFLIGHFVQSQVIPEFPSFLSKNKFDTKLKEILNSKIIIKPKDKNDEKNNLTDLVKYTIDVTGELSIPKNIELARFGELIVIYSIKDDVEFSKKIKEAQKNKGYSIDYALYTTEEGKNIKVDFSERIYCIKELGSTTPPINKLTILFSLLLLQWIQALYYILTWKMVLINPIKIVGTKIEHQFRQSIINVHGNEYKSMAYNTNEKKKKKKDNEIKEKKEEKNEYQPPAEDASINVID